MSSENPYKSPRTDLARPGMLTRFWGWFLDRLMLVGTALGITAMLFAGMMVFIVLNWPMHNYFILFFGLPTLAGFVAYCRALMRSRG